MKKLLLLAASAYLFAASATAQVRFAPEIGLNFSRFSYSFDDDHFDPLNESSNTGLRAGIAVDICVAKNFTIQPGIYYSMKGGEREYVVPAGHVVSPFTGNVVFINGADVEESVNLSYIEIPVLLNYYISAGPGRVFIGAGPTFSFGVGGDVERKIDNPGNGVEIEDEFDIDFGDDGHIKGSDVGIMVNLGYDFDFGLFVRPFYNWGLSDLSQLDNFSVHNRTFGIGLGYWFGKK